MIIDYIICSHSTIYVLFSGHVIKYVIFDLVIFNSEIFGQVTVCDFRPYGNPIQKQTTVQYKITRRSNIHIVIVSDKTIILVG